MLGLLLNPTNPAVSPEGLLPHESAKHRRRAWIRAGRRLLNGWITTAIAYREQQAAWVELHHAANRDPKNIYRSPIDDALEKAARLRERRRLKQRRTNQIA